MISNDTHIPISLPFGNQVPTQQEILDRFKKQYSGFKPLLPVLTTCAEQAEKMMHELFIQKLEKRVKIRAQRYTAGKPKTHGYQCPVCFAGQINKTHKFCHGCGRQIQWK